MRAREDWERIPEAYKAGIDGLLIEREAKAHPRLDEVYTLGECLTESYPSAFGGPETIRSWVVLYYGSFLRLSKRDETFDWQEEIWETLTHELQHHLESLAADEGLLDIDYAADENFKRLEGEAFDTAFYRAAEAVGGGWYVLEGEYFYETYDREERIPFEWEAQRYEVRVPAAELAGGTEAVFLRVTAGLSDPPRELYVVLRRRASWREALRSLLGRSVATYAEYDVVAEAASS